MKRFIQICRHYCKESKVCAKIDYKKLNHSSKVPSQVQKSNQYNVEANIELDAQTIYRLERLSLVTVEDKQALETLQKSIEFALKISKVNTDNVKPLYSVLEYQHLHLRPDKVTEGGCPEEILQNAKLTDEDYFISPPGNIPIEKEKKNF